MARNRQDVDSPTLEVPLTDLRIFLFGNSGYASVLLSSLIARGENVIGVCTRPEDSLMRRVRRQIGHLSRNIGLQTDAFILPGPFDHLQTPHRIARQAGIPVLNSAELRAARFADRIRRHRPDVVLVAGFHRLIPTSVFGLARLAAINFHPGLLPKHRGGTPNRWVIRLGEGESGVTAHLLSEEFDKGDVLAERRVSVGANDTWGDLEARIVGILVPFVCEVLDTVRQGRIDPRPQSDAAARYEPPLKGDHLVIDWSLSVSEIRRICYAIRPKSGGITDYRGQRVCIWDLEPAESERTDRDPGTIVRVDADGRPLVACGDGVARVTRFVRRGRVVPAAAVVRALNLRPPGKFGPAPPSQPGSPRGYQGDRSGV